MQFPTDIALLIKQFILIFIILFMNILSQDLLMLNSIKTVPWKRAFVDNLTHICLGIVSWQVAISFEKPFLPWNIACSLLCGLFAGFIDIDHFLMAKSFKLNDALNLPSRPPFHNTTLMLLCILSFILIMHIIGSAKIAYIGWIFLVAAISHHLRDAMHRGLWLWPAKLKPMDSSACLMFIYSCPLFIGVMIHLIYKPYRHLITYDDVIL